MTQPISLNPDQCREIADALRGVAGMPRQLVTGQSINSPVTAAIDARREYARTLCEQVPCTYCDDNSGYITRVFYGGETGTKTLRCPKCNPISLAERAAPAREMETVAA